MGSEIPLVQMRKNLRTYIIINDVASRHNIIFVLLFRYLEVYIMIVVLFRVMGTMMATTVDTADTTMHMAQTTMHMAQTGTFTATIFTNSHQNPPRCYKKWYSKWYLSEQGDSKLSVKKTKCWPQASASPSSWHSLQSYGSHEMFRKSNQNTYPLVIKSWIGHHLQEMPYPLQDMKDYLLLTICHTTLLYFVYRHREVHVNQYNAARQHAVNAAAEHYGAGTGTARHYGVPGNVGKHKY